MKFNLKITLLVCILLSGCVTINSLKTSGQATTALKFSKLVVFYDPTLPASISIERNFTGFAANQIASDQNTALKRSQQLTDLLSEGFRNRFSVKAAKSGLTIVDSGDVAPNLNIHVVSQRMVCSHIGCQTLLNLRGEVFRKGEKPFWSFSSEVGQPIVEARMNNELFDIISEAILNSLKEDGLIAAQ